MDIQTIAQHMLKRINALEQARGRLEQLAHQKAEKTAFYEKDLAITIIRIRNGMEVELDEKHITNPPVSIIEKIAKGVCWRQKLAMDQAEALYKSEIVCLSALAAELNGYQSINRYLKDEV